LLGAEPILLLWLLGGLQLECPGREVTYHTRHKTPVRIYVRPVLVGLSAHKRVLVVTTFTVVPPDRRLLCGAKTSWICADLPACLRRRTSAWPLPTRTPYTSVIGDSPEPYAPNVVEGEFSEVRMQHTAYIALREARGWLLRPFTPRGGGLHILWCWMDMQRDE
jgi:hypothetical protein